MRMALRGPLRDTPFSVVRSTAVAPRELAERVVFQNVR